MTPQIIVPDTGFHNKDLTASISRLEKEGSYADLSCVVLIPAFGTVPTKVLASWWNSYFPPNQTAHKIFAVGMEVGEAFTQTIQFILDHPQLSKFKYILTAEHDNIPPPDGLIKLQQQMEAHPEYDCIGGLYFTKGEGGMPQIWGDPRDPTSNFRPQPPIAGQLVECCGTGMGFNLWRLQMFRDDRLRKPWFKTQTEGGVSTQDLHFWSDARQHGYRCAIDTSVPIGHYDLEGKFGPPDTTW
jgi:hypothetical protein